MSTPRALPPAGGALLNAAWVRWLRRVSQHLMRIASHLPQKT
ncbi:MAG: hypothetical protein WBN89_06260 [Prochlorococcaceae cyanobacterium]